MPSIFLMASSAPCTKQLLKTTPAHEATAWDKSWEKNPTLKTGQNLSPSQISGNPPANFHEAGHFPPPVSQRRKAVIEYESDCRLRCRACFCAACKTHTTASQHRATSSQGCPISRDHWCCWTKPELNKCQPHCSPSLPWVLYSKLGGKEAPIAFHMKINVVAPEPVSSCHLSSSQSHNTGCRNLEPPTASLEEFNDRNTQVTPLRSRNAERGKPLPVTSTMHSAFL